jgi:hypothetical protein
VAAIERYMVAVGELSLAEPFFKLTQPRKHGLHASGPFVTAVDVTHGLRKHCETVGLVPKRVSCRSVRPGGAFTMTDGGATAEARNQRGRWSDTAGNYMGRLYARMSEVRLTEVGQAMTRKPSRLLQPSRL